ncbi:MAG: hypothetical protein Greene041619_662 [Candidatus Peregrinibacteria bacterium Greene0416_19]|nr:MAG: hypothetical protein Greene041619_662 [Candidatus Peregrinibacteria bacterium Greene0416_19]
MRLFALETDTGKLCESLLADQECPMLTVRFHGFLFFLRFVVAMLLTLLLAGIAVVASEVGLPLLWAIGLAFVLWFVAIFFRLLKAYIDWKFDLLFVTDEKIVLVNQTSIVHRIVRQMNLENLASVHAETQYWNLLPFGIVCFDLKEGTGQKMCLKYIPEAERVAKVVGEVLVQFQRRQASA